MDYLLTTNIGKGNIYVVDGGSTDNTCDVVREKGVNLLNTDASRAIQMNYGAKASDKEWLYFIHADTVPPESWPSDFEELKKRELEAGTYRSFFDKGPFGWIKKLLGQRAYKPGLSEHR